MSVSCWRILVTANDSTSSDACKQANIERSARGRRLRWPTVSCLLPSALTLSASGKTSFYRRYFADHAHVNQDTLGTRDKCLKAAKGHLLEKRAVVIDNTNRDAKTRKVWVDLAKEFGVPVR